MRRNPLPGVALLVLGVVVGCAISPVASAAAGEVSQLIATLKTGTPDAREHAAERLACGYCGYTDEAVSALVALLADGDDQERADAAYALTLIDDGALFTPHLDALLGAFNNDAYWRVRANLAYVLAAMPDSSQVLTTLRDALHDPDAHVRAAGVYNLEAVARAQKANAKIVPDLLPALSDADRTVRYAAATGLAKIGSTDRHTVDVLAGRLGVEPDPWVRGTLAGALGAAGEAAAPALPALIKAIVDPYPLYVAEPATRAIARLGPVGIPALVAALGYDMLGDGRVVAAAVDGLAQMPGPLADRLGDDLKNGPVAVRSGIAQVLGRRAQEAAVAIPLLKGALDDPEPAVRADAAQALAKLADKTLDPSALQGLVLALADADVSVRVPAVNGIERLTGRLADPAVDAVFGGAVGDAAAKALAAALLDEDAGVAGVAAQALGELGPRAAAAVPPLQAALMSPHSNIASDVAKALAKLGPPGTRALLVGVRQGGSPPDGIELGTIRWAALSALEDIASPKAFGAQTDAVVAAIITALADSRTDVRAEAANVLGVIGPAAHAAVAPLKNALLQLTEDDNEDDIAALAIGLGHLGAQAAPALLDVLAGGNPAIAAAAAQGLGQMELGALGAEQNQVVAGLLAAMHRADANVRGAAAMGLGDFGLQKVDLGAQRARVIAALKAQAAHDADQVAQFQASTALGLLGVNS